MEPRWFYLLLGYLTLSDSLGKKETCLSQPEEMRSPVGSSVEVKCAVRGDCPGQPWTHEWFLVKENYHIRLNLGQSPDKFRLNGANLLISSLQVNDSGIYHCAAVSRGPPGPGRQHVGPGTTLTVQERTELSIYLWVFFGVLLLYSLVVGTLILKKCNCKKIHQINKFNSTKKMQFQDVLQEMHGKKFQRRSKESSGGSGGGGGGGSGGPRTEGDDIYQNVKERFEMAD